MLGVSHKAKTTLEYALTGIRIGANLQSKWLLASMLPRLKWQLAGGFPNLKAYTAEIEVGNLRHVLYLRAQDIFIVHEIFGQVPYILPQMKEDPPHCILDLRAHIGLATLRFKAEFPKATVHCYEPDSDNFALLKLNTEGLKGVVLHQEAVGAVSGEMTFYVLPDRHSASSLKRPRELVILEHTTFTKVKIKRRIGDPPC